MLLVTVMSPLREDNVAGRFLGEAMGEVGDGLLPFFQARVRIAPAAVKPLEIDGRGLGCLLGEGFDGGRVVGHLGLRIGPLAGELGTQLEQPGVSRLSSEPFIDGCPKGIQQFAGRRIVDESLPGQLDHFRFFAPGVSHRESDLRSGFPRQQLVESRGSLWSTRCRSLSR